MVQLHAVALTIAVASASLLVSPVHADTNAHRELTNAERFARGLPPLAPVGLVRTPTRRTPNPNPFMDELSDENRYHNYKRAGSSPQPCAATCEPDLSQKITDYVLDHLDNRVSAYVLDHLDNRVVDYVNSRTDRRVTTTVQNQLFGSCQRPSKRSLLESESDSSSEFSSPVEKSTIPSAPILEPENDTLSKRSPEADSDSAHRPVFSKRGGDDYLGEIATYAFNFCPVGWLEAAGQLLPISQNPALFSLLGTQYGGDGSKTFALPDLRQITTCGMKSCIAIDGVYPTRP